MIARPRHPFALPGARHRRLAAALLLVVALLLPTLGAAAGPSAGPAAAPGTSAATYTVTEIFPLPGFSTITPADLNAGGQVAGYSSIKDNSVTWFTNATRWQGSQLDLGDIGAAGAIAAINAGGDLVGMQNASSTSNGRAIAIRGGTLTDLAPLLGTPYSRAFGINDAGTIVGEAGIISFDARPFSIAGQTVTQLPLPTGATIGAARDINNAGTIVGSTGTFRNGVTASTATVWQNGGVAVLPHLAGKTNSTATAVNASGLVVGSSYVDGGRDTRAVLWQNGVATQLGNLEFSRAAGINASGQIVGNALIGKPFIYANGTLTELNTLLPAGCTLVSADAINDNGQIVGVGSCNNSAAGALLLSPPGVPVPSPSPSPSPSGPPATVAMQQSAGGSATLLTPGPYTVGQTIRAAATPNAGQLLVGWQGSGFALPTGARPIGVAQGADVVAFATAGTIGAWANPLTATVTNANVVLKPVFVARPAFGDVASNNPAADAIANLAARGVINGCDREATPPLFCPAAPTLRHQMAALIARGMPGWVDETGLPTFTDNTDDTELMTRVATLQRYGVVRGYQDAVCAEQGKQAPCYGPLDTVKYGQVMLFIARAMVEKGYWTLAADDRTIFPDQNGAIGADPDTDQQTKDHRMVVTYVKYVGAPPDVASTTANFALANGQGWGDAAPRAWFARAFWPALQSYFGK